MDDLKGVIAVNLIALRKEANMTQLEMAEKLNYSDKAVSKWERAESIPDVGTLKEAAALFGVTVDYLLQAEHPAKEDPHHEYTHRQRRNHTIITTMSTMLVWLIATFIFVNIDMFTSGLTGHWLVFVYAVPVSSIVLLVFNSVWGRKRMNFLIVSVLVWSVLLCIYLTALSYNLWLIFLIGIPAQIIIFLWSGLKLK